MMQKLKQRLNSSDPSMLQQIAHAKINLALQITGKRDDGFHLLNTFVCFTMYGDRLSLKETSSQDQLITLKVMGPFATDLGSVEDNLILKAARLLADKLKKLGHACSSIQITLEKNLPIASGIGGGSADAAATIRLLKEFWQVPDSLDLDSICQELGADVPMCLHSKPLIAQGIGGTILPLDLDKELHIVLVNPRVEVSTPEVFKALNFDKSSKVNEIDLAALFSEGKFEQLSNDLQSVATHLHPRINEALSSIAKTKSFHFGMSGSGATCFGLYENEGDAQFALSQIKQNNPQIWAIATTTIHS